VGGIVALVALVAGAAAPAGADQIDDLRNAVAGARAAADAATQRYADAENHVEALGIEIESLQREIDANRGLSAREARAGADYVSVMRANLRILRHALGCV
jgi:hypothetical protein